MKVLIQCRYNYDSTVLSGFQGVSSHCPCWQLGNSRIVCSGWPWGLGKKTLLVLWNSPTIQQTLPSFQSPGVGWLHFLLPGAARLEGELIVPHVHWPFPHKKILPTRDPELLMPCWGAFPWFVCDFMSRSWQSHSKEFYLVVGTE